MVTPQALDEDIGHRDDRGEKGDSERDGEQGDDDHDDEDRQRRHHEKPEKHDGGYVDRLKRAGGHAACQRGVVLDPLDEGGRLGNVRSSR